MRYEVFTAVLLACLLVLLFILKIGAVRSSETSVNYEIIRRHIPENSTSQTLTRHQCTNNVIGLLQSLKCKFLLQFRTVKTLKEELQVPYPTTELRS
jgi:hypothetical protein